MGFQNIVIICFARIQIWLSKGNTHFHCENFILKKEIFLGGY
jgi:hypothetical protein